MKSVFISHNKADKNIASEIALFIVAENINVWFDEWEISAGDSIIDKIEDGLSDCSHFILLWSKNASKSNWVRKELKSAIVDAISSGVPKIIPIVLDNTKKPKLINDIHHISYDKGSEKNRTDIIESIKGNLPTINFIKAIVKKYKEVIYDFSTGDPIGVKYCPECGSDNFEGGASYDESRDKQYYYIKCRDCDWYEWTQ